MAKQQVTVPDIGGAEGAEVIELLVAVGDEIALDQSLIVLESDKASMEIPSTAAGTLVELLVTEGEQLAEGSSSPLLRRPGIAQRSKPRASGCDGRSRAPAGTGDRQEAPSEPQASCSMLRPPLHPQSDAAVRRASGPVPDIGTDEAVELIEVCVKVGDAVAEGDSLVVLESDKASMEVPAPAAGEVLEILVAKVAASSRAIPLLRLQSGAGDSVAPAPHAPAPAQRRPGPAQGSRSRSPKPVPAAAPAKAAAAAPASTEISTRARRCASWPGSLVSSWIWLAGTGPRGRMLKEDLQLVRTEFAESRARLQLRWSAHYRLFLTSTFLHSVR